MKITRIFLAVIFLVLSAISGNAKVLIIQDTSPWGSAAIQNTLNANWVFFDEITSSQLAATTLSQYTMIIMPSVQGDSFYTNWNASLDKVKEYVRDGGKLWMSACVMGTTTVMPLIPGGVLVSYEEQLSNLIVEPDHPWVRGMAKQINGTSASHTGFAALYPGSTVIAVADDQYRHPVLVDFRYGAGRIFLTGQTLEYAWEHGQDAKPILENSLMELLASRDEYLIVQDRYPWAAWIAGGFRSIQNVLTLNDIPYDQVASADLAAMSQQTLGAYKMIIVPGMQGSDFYITWNQNIAKISQYVYEGGKLWQSTCNESSTLPEPLAPGGVVSSTDLEFYNSIVAPNHPWVQGVESPMYGSGASHDSFSNLYPGSTIIAVARDTGKPVLVDYHYGAGRVLLTGQTLEYAWDSDWDGKPVLENSLLDLKNAVDDVLIIQNSLPEGYAVTQNVLSANGISYDIISSSRIAGTDLTPYRMIVAPGFQNDAYYADWNANVGKIEAYVAGGGTLWQSTCNLPTVSTEPLVPGGVVSAADADTVNMVESPGHPWVRGEPTEMHGTYMSYKSFTSLAPKSKIIVTTRTSGLPVLVDYPFGEGRVLITGQALERARQNSLDGRLILEQSLLDLLAPQKTFPWNLFLPAIIHSPGKSSAWMTR